MDKHKNRLFYGDCLNVLKELLEGKQPQYLDYGYAKKGCQRKEKRYAGKIDLTT